MLKVLFYHANDTLTLSASDKSLFLGISALYLKTYLDTKYETFADQIEWLLPLQHKLDDNDLLEIIYQHKPDLFCTSHYIWNSSFLFSQLERIQNKIPRNTKIVVGGPSIDVHINSNFFKTYPFVDYAIYGPGEQAFADLTRSILENKKIIKFNTSNLAWLDQTTNKTMIADYSYVPQIQVSPFLVNKSMFTDMVENEQQKGITVVVPYELTRGCPYSCTFCDWNSGFGNKVTRRKNTYQLEIDLFQKLKIKNLYLSDANVGQYQEDIDMIAYLSQKNIKENAGFQLDGNFSKLKKDANLKIYHLMGKSNLATDLGGFTFSVTDINEEVLKNIDRPDVGWQTHKLMIRELYSNYPNKNAKIQLIIGLPGQTKLSLRQTFKEVCREHVHLQPFINELLAASPASLTKTYQEKFHFTYSNSERYHQGHYFRSTISESCFSFSKRDLVEMVVMATFYCAVMYFLEKLKVTIDIEPTVDKFLLSDEYRVLVNNLYTNWEDQDKFYYTVNIDGSYSIESACQLHTTAMNWTKNAKFIKFVSSYLPVETKNYVLKNLIAKNKTIKSLGIKHYV